MTERTTRERIVESAIREFSKNYYDNASINNIIKESSTSKGTFYHYFKDKEDLYFQLIDMVVKEKIEYINVRVSEELKVSSEMTLFSENFRILTRIGMEFAANNPLYYELGIRMLEEPNLDILNSIIGKYGNQSEHFIAQLVDKAIENGSIDKSLSRDFIIKLVTFIFSNLTKFIPPEESTDFNKMIAYLDQIYFVLENGLKPREIINK